MVTWRERTAFVVVPALAILAAPLEGYRDDFIELMPTEATALAATSTALL